MEEGLPSVVDPILNRLNLDPSPGFCPQLDPDSNPVLYYQFWKKIQKLIFKKQISFKKSIFLNNYKNKMPPLYLHFILYLHVWIRIRIWNTDPDPESSWIRIRIHPHWFCRYVGDLNFFGLTYFVLSCYSIELHHVQVVTCCPWCPVPPPPAAAGSARTPTWRAGTMTRSPPSRWPLATVLSSRSCLDWFLPWQKTI